MKPAALPFIGNLAAFSWRCPASWTLLWRALADIHWVGAVMNQANCRWIEPLWHCTQSCHRQPRPILGSSLLLAFNVLGILLCRLIVVGPLQRIHKIPGPRRFLFEHLRRPWQLFTNAQRGTHCGNVQEERVVLVLRGAQHCLQPPVIYFGVPVLRSPFPFPPTPDPAPLGVYETLKWGGRLLPDCQLPQNLLSRPLLLLFHFQKSIWGNTSCKPLTTAPHHAHLLSSATAHLPPEQRPPPSCIVHVLAFVICLQRPAVSTSCCRRCTCCRRCAVSAVSPMFVGQFIAAAGRLLVGAWLVVHVVLPRLCFRGGQHLWPAVPHMHASHGRAGAAPSFVLWLASSNGVLWRCIGARACMQWVILKTGLANAQASAILSASRTSWLFHRKQICCPLWILRLLFSAFLRLPLQLPSFWNWRAHFLLETGEYVSLCPKLFDLGDLDLAVEWERSGMLGSQRNALSRTHPFVPSPKLLASPCHRSWVSWFLFGSDGHRRAPTQMKARRQCFRPHSSPSNPWLDRQARNPRRSWNALAANFARHAFEDIWSWPWHSPEPRPSSAVWVALAISAQWFHHGRCELWHDQNRQWRPPWVRLLHLHEFGIE